MAWKNKLKHIEARVGIAKTVFFQRTKEIKEYDTIVSSCACSTPTYNKTTRTLYIKYVPKSFPKHLKYNPHYDTKKSATIFYKDGTKETLSFTARVRK